ncbi:hypothetical protein CCHR01_09138 [Colletotrichum chrysophilum]|uniref:Uncharacterized protein n=1 Tax=Colletotrichum chrysophilum TaxID=1836956 RepID=A0AAD9AHN5_9PEZI|nr:hypothetical protein CCHR01_09138 [Colletotrichum chrysophilum]
MDDGEGLFERVVFASLFGGPIETFDLRLEKAAHLPRTGRSQEADPPTSALEGADRRIARRVSCQGSLPRAAERSKTGPTCSGDTRDFGSTAVRDGAKSGLTKCSGATEKTEEILLTLGILGRGYHENRAVSVSRHPADALRPGATFNFEVLLTPSTKEKMQRDEPS